MSELTLEEEARQIDPERCIVSVKGCWDVWPHQCSRKRGHGTKGLYCKQHSDLPKPMTETREGNYE